MFLFALLSGALGDARIVDVFLAANVPGLTWRPKLSHTIVLFPKAHDGAVKIQLVGPTNLVVSTLSTDKNVFGIHFGSAVDTGLQFSADRRTTFHFFVYEPPFVPTRYLISTFPRDSFVLASPLLCARADFPIDPTTSTGFFHFFRGDRKAIITQNQTMPTDFLRQPTPDDPLTGPLPIASVAGEATVRGFSL
jgi:hypothetical protein